MQAAVEEGLPTGYPGRHEVSKLEYFSRGKDIIPRTHSWIRLVLGVIGEGTEMRKVLVVGAGPVGSLAALYAANRGDQVEIYEIRGGKSRPVLHSLRSW